MERAQAFNLHPTSMSTARSIDPHLTSCSAQHCMGAPPSGTIIKIMNINKKGDTMMGSKHGS